MTGPEIVWKHFPHLDARQRQQIEALDALYRHWNAQINVISRKDIDNLYLHHVLHSLAIGKEVAFAPAAEVLEEGLRTLFGVRPPRTWARAGASRASPWPSFSPKPDSRSSTALARRSRWCRPWPRRSAWTTWRPCTCAPKC